MLGNLSNEDLIKQLYMLYDDAPFFVCYKSPTLSIYYANQVMRDYVGSRTLENIEGKSDYDFCWERFADLYTAHERDAIEKNIYTALFPVCDHEGENALATCNRMPIFNSENKVQGVLSHSHFLKNPSALELGNMLLELRSPRNHYTIDKNKDLIDLTDREKACLFFMIRGKSCKGIAQILGIAHRTVESYINNLKIKFTCLSKADLIERAIELGYHYDLPSCVLSYFDCK